MSHPRAGIPQEVFLSHSHRDRPFVRKVAAALHAHGIPVWYCEHNILGADQWHDEIGRALERCDWIVVVMSPNSVRSKWVKRELLYALQEDRYEGRIVPLLRRQCDVLKLSWTLGGLQAVDFTGGFTKGCRQLLRTWGFGYKMR
jgi:hypothetical protein